MTEILKAVIGMVTSVLVALIGAYGSLNGVRKSKGGGKFPGNAILFVLLLISALGGVSAFTSYFAYQKAVIAIERQLPPIGSIVAWHGNIGGGPLSDGWLPCDGRVVEDSNSPLFRKTLPDLNNPVQDADGTKYGGGGRFLRGGGVGGAPAVGTLESATFSLGQIPWEGLIPNQIVQVQAYAQPGYSQVEEAKKEIVRSTANWKAVASVPNEEATMPMFYAARPACMVVTWIIRIK